MTTMDDELLEDLYAWVDQIPLSRPKKNIQRDFSDGVLIAEIVKHFCPRIVELHNYVPASKTDKKLTNWSLLNRKVFKKLGFEITDDVMQNIVQCKPMSVEQFLMLLRRKIDRHMYETQRDHGQPQATDRQMSDRPEADQNIMNADNVYSISMQPSPNPTGLPTGHFPHFLDTGPSFADMYSPQFAANMKPGQHPASNRDLSRQPPVPPIGGGEQRGGVLPSGSKMNVKSYKTDLVPKMAVEEKEQEILAKDETIQILQAKVRRLEHLLHLKDIRIDDLQSRLDRMGMDLRPTAKGKK